MGKLRGLAGGGLRARPGGLQAQAGGVFRLRWGGIPASTEEDPPQMATAADSMHPIGMHSCFHSNRLQIKVSLNCSNICLAKLTV